MKRIMILNDDWYLFGETAIVQKEFENSYICVLESDIVKKLKYTIRVSKNDVKVLE